MCVKEVHCTRVLKVGTQYFMHYKLCDVISFNLAVAAGKLSVHNKIVIENPKKEIRWRLEKLS